MWHDFRTIDENALHRTGRRIENASEGTTLHIEKKAESSGALNAYIYLIMDAQFRQERSILSITKKMLTMIEPQTVQQEQEKRI